MAKKQASPAPGGWLFKEEPTHYSYAQLEKDGSTLWSGVANPLALKHLRQVRVGDRVLYYHTGKELAIVGEMRVTEAAQADPAAKRSEGRGRSSRAGAELAPAGDAGPDQGGPPLRQLGTDSHAAPFRDAGQPRTMEMVGRACRLWRAPGILTVPSLSYNGSGFKEGRFPKAAFSRPA